MYSIKQNGGVFGIYTVPSNFPLIKDLDPNEIVNKEKLSFLSKKGIDVNIRSTAKNNLIGRNLDGVSNNDIHIHPLSKETSYPISINEHWIASSEQNINLKSTILGDIDVRPHLEYTETYLPLSQECQISYQYWLGPVQNGKESPFYKTKKNHKISYTINVKGNIPNGESLIESGNHLKYQDVALSINLKSKGFILLNYNKLSNKKDFIDNARTIFDCYINLTNLINQFMNERLRNQTLFSVDQNTKQSVAASLTASLFSKSTKALDVHKIKSNNKKYGGSFFAVSAFSSDSDDEEESNDIPDKKISASISKSLYIPKNITLYDYFNPITKKVTKMLTSGISSIPKDKLEKYLSIYEMFGEQSLKTNFKKQKKKQGEIEHILSTVKEESESRSLKVATSFTSFPKKEVVMEIMNSKPAAKMKTVKKEIPIAHKKTVNKKVVQPIDKKSKTAKPSSKRTQKNKGNKSKKKKGGKKGK
jgi:hypothetical protein